MDSKTLPTEHVDVAANEAHSGGAVLAQRREVINFEESQHKQTRMQSFREDWRGIGWCIQPQTLSIAPAKHPQAYICSSSA
jgi:hypothetical protein